MPNWTESMQQTFEYYIVDPNTWRDMKPLTTVKSCTIERDLEAETLGSATFDITESVGECYIRVYLITIQNGVREKHPLGTFLVQTPSSGFDGKLRSVSMDAYTPLLELKENPPPLGYYVPKGDDILEFVYTATREHLRAPVVKTSSKSPLNSNFVADPSDTWLSFLSDLLHNAKYRYELDELGRVMFAPDQDSRALQPIWTYDDGNSSILYPDLEMDHDLFGVPNVVVVVSSEGGGCASGRAENNDPNSPTSIVNRGRTITHRIQDPGPVGDLNVYAEQQLRELSSLEYTITYTHGYCPTRLGDCIRLNYSRAGLLDIKAKIISQSISCEPGCPVTEKAVYTAKLWG